MKILYLSCHSILEFEEVSLFHELGYEVFSPGAYVEPANPSTLRPSIDSLVYDTDIIQQWDKICNLHPGEDGKDHLTKEFVDNFDCIIVMHLPRYIQNNWDAIKHKRVIWRTIGQSVASTEQSLKQYRNEGLEIVRYSPMEVNIPGFIGQDALIRFYKDPAQYANWNGQRERVITFGQSMKQREPACGFSIFEEVTRRFPRHLFGPGNESIGDWATGKVSYDQLKQEMRDNRVYFYTGTHPASYTLNFMEAWMTGIPIVAIGPQHGNASYFHNHNLYEIPHLINHGVSGFISDDKAELQYFIQMLMSSHDVAKQISANARQEAIRHFGKDMIGKAWEQYLGGK